MLQQTQVDRVLDVFPRWMEQFPDIRSLAHASRRDVILAWSGMGYNRRALFLHATAQQLVTEFNGDIPSDVNLLQELPGIGRYTARAIACFGFHERVAFVETNIARVLSRLTKRLQNTSDRLSLKECWKLADEFLPQNSFLEWNHALMDFGARICTARDPACTRCPVAHHCKSAGKLMKSRPSQRVTKTIPRRIYRGKILEALRSTPGHSTQVPRIAERFKLEIDAYGISWLIDILASLERDGLIAGTKLRRPCSLHSLSHVKGVSVHLHA